MYFFSILFFLLSFNSLPLKAADITVIQVQIDDLEFKCRVAGDPRQQAIVFLHGFPESAVMWAETMSMMSEKGYYCIAPDMRGYSQGARPRGLKNYDLELICNDVISIMKSMQKTNFHVIGHDWGAAVGWALAGKYPQHILSFFALSVPNLSAFSKAIKEDKAQYKMSNYARLFQLRGIPEWVIKRKNLEIFRKNCWYLSSDEEKQAYIDLYKEKRALTCTLNWYRRNWSRMTKLALQFKNEAITVPTTYIWGNKDSSVGRFAAEQTASYMKGTYQFIELEASHWLIQEKKEAVWKALSKHFKK